MSFTDLKCQFFNQKNLFRFSIPLCNFYVSIQNSFSTVAQYSALYKYIKEKCIKILTLCNQFSKRCHATYFILLCVDNINVGWQNVDKIVERRS